MPSQFLYKLSFQIIRPSDGPEIVKFVRLVRLFRISRINAEIFGFVVWQLVVGSGKQKFYSYNCRFY